MKRSLFMVVMAIFVMAVIGVWLESKYFSTSIAQPTSQATKVFRMRIQSAMPSASIHQEYLNNLAKLVKDASGGRLLITVLPAGTVVEAFEILDAVHKGLVEAGYAWSHFWTGKHPACGLFSSPPAALGTGLDQIAHFSWYYYGGGRELHKQLYQDEIKFNVVPFFVSVTGPEALGWFKKKFTTMEELKGVRFRTPPGLPGEVYAELGIKPVFLAPAELMPSAERGIVDAGEISMPADDITFGLYRAWKNYYLQGAHQNLDSGELLINKDFWNSLPEDLRALMEVAILATVMDSLIINIQRNGVALARLQKEFGVVVQETPPEYFPQYAKATEKVIAKYSAKSPFFKKVVDSYYQFAKDVIPFQKHVHKTNLSIAEASLVLTPSPKKK